jgi:ubiquinone/menaquinone biosynthesis C-methylase UbiE
MKKFSNFIFVVIALCFTFLGNAQSKYILKSGDVNGINKWYMGRQIAQVMSHYGIEWLEREERDKEENTSLLLKNLNVQPGMMIADIGAGSGYHSSLLSKMVGSGKVYAVDVELEMIAFLKDRIKTEKTKNVVPVLSTEQTVGLPANSIDLMLLVDVYHEFSYPYEMGVAMLEALKPGGKLVLVEFRTEDEMVPIKTIHKMSEQQAVREFKAAGFIFEKNISNLPWQHCMVFRKNK